MEEKIIRWILAVVVFYAIFILIWKRFWDGIDPPAPPGDDELEFKHPPKEKIRRRHNDDE